MTEKPKTPPAGGQPTQVPRTTIASILDLRLPQTQLELAHGVPVLVDVPIDKPPKSHFFRVHPGEEFASTFSLLDARKMGAGDGMYAVTKEVAALITDQLRLVQLRLAVTNFGVPYLLPMPLPGPDGRSNPWHVSLARAVKLAESKWIRVTSNMVRGAYDVFEAQGDLGEPKWPAESFEELLKIAFQGRIIDADDHPFVMQLLGRA